MEIYSWVNLIQDGGHSQLILEDTKLANAVSFLNLML